MKVLLNAEDISSYVIGCTEVPIRERNRDWTLIVSSFDADISSAYTGRISINDNISFYITNDEYPDFYGYITDTQYNYENRSTKIYVNSAIGKLQDYKVTHANIYYQVYDTADKDQYNPSDNEGYSNINLIYLLEKMFAHAGLTLFSSYLNNIDLETIVVSGVSYNIKLSHVLLDENMLYCLNQQNAFQYSLFSTNPERLKDTITYFDFVSRVCSDFGLVLELMTDYPYDPLTFRLYKPTTESLYSITGSESNIYKYNLKAFQADKTGYSWQHRFNARLDYHRAGDFTLTTQASGANGDGGNSFEPYTNLAYMYKKLNSVNDGDTWGLSHYYPAYNLTEGYGMLKKRIDVDTKNYNKVEVTRNMTRALEVNYCAFDIENRTTIIEHDLATA